jgi:hypothetical protein
MNLIISWMRLCLWSISLQSLIITKCCWYIILIGFIIIDRLFITFILFGSLRILINCGLLILLVDLSEHIFAELLNRRYSINNDASSWNGLWLIGSTWNGCDGYLLSIISCVSIILRPCPPPSEFCHHSLLFIFVIGMATHVILLYNRG